jgi:FMN phosphatase YigB (HAD superfamily)
MKNKINFIYFDVGGVLVKDFSATNKWDLMTNEWGIDKDKKTELHELFNKFEEEVAVGRSVEDFVPMAREKFGAKFPKNYSLNRDFVNRFYKNEGLEKIINKIRDKYELGLLTAMYPGMLKMIREKKLIPEIQWKVIVDSSIVKCTKPGVEIYKIAQEMAKVEAGEILFVDNKKINLEVPKKMGWQTFWFDSKDYEKSNKELEEFLKN